MTDTTAPAIDPDIRAHLAAARDGLAALADDRRFANVFPGMVRTLDQWVALLDGLVRLA